MAQCGLPIDSTYGSFRPVNQGRWEDDFRYGASRNLLHRDGEEFPDGSRRGYQDYERLASCYGGQDPYFYENLDP